MKLKNCEKWDGSIPKQVYALYKSSKAITASPHKVLEDLSLSLRKQHGKHNVCSYRLFAATELLLAYYAKKQISDPDIGSLLKYEFGYANAFADLFDAQLDYKCEQDTCTYSSRKQYVSYLEDISGRSFSYLHGRRRKIYNHYLALIQGVAASLQQIEAESKGVKPDRAMASRYLRVENTSINPSIVQEDSVEHPDMKRLFRSKTYWLHYCKYAEAMFPVRAGVAESYERELTSIPAFIEDSRRLVKAIRLSKWMYWHESNWFECQKGNAPLLHEYRLKVETFLSAFCSKWCLQYVGVLQPSLKCEYNKVIYYRARRTRVEVAPNGDGLNVFIPRYYQFSHLKNHAASDFEPLKDAMDNVYGQFRKTKEVKMTHKQICQYASAQYHELQKLGLDKIQAWDQVRKDMAWSHATMTSNVTAEPRLRI